MITCWETMYVQQQWCVILHAVACSTHFLNTRRVRYRDSCQFIQIGTLVELLRPSCPAFAKPTFAIYKKMLSLFYIRRCKNWPGKSSAIRHFAVKVPYKHKVSFNEDKLQRWHSTILYLLTKKLCISNQVTNSKLMKHTCILRKIKFSPITFT